MNNVTWPLRAGGGGGVGGGGGELGGNFKLLTVLICT